MRQAFVFEALDLPAHQFGAHVHAAEIILQIMRENAEQFVLVLGQLFEAVARGFQRQLRPHARNQFGMVERFGDVIHAARVQRPDNQILVVRGGKKNDRDVLPVGIVL